MDIQAPATAQQPGNTNQNKVQPGQPRQSSPNQQQSQGQRQSDGHGPELTPQKQKQPIADPKYYEINGERLTESQMIAEVKRQKEHSRAANERFRQANELAKEFSSLKEAAAAGDSKAVRKLLRNFGADDMKIAQDIISEEYENVSMSPEQREMRRRQEELDAREQKYKEREQTEQQQMSQKQQHEILNAITSEAVTAFEQLGHKPDPLTLSLFATQLKSGFEDVQNLTRADIYEAAKNVQQSEMRVTQKNILGVREASQLRQRIGDQAYRHLKQIFEQEVTSKYPQQYQNNRPQQQTSTRSSNREPAKPITSQKELYKQLGIAR